MLTLFRGVCSAIQYMHTYKRPGGGRRQYPAKNPITGGEDDVHRQDTAPLLSGQTHQEQSSSIETHPPGKEDDIIPWAHRDIKPG